jgi:hypothetical protein
MQCSGSLQGRSGETRQKSCVMLSRVDRQKPVTHGIARDDVGTAGISLPGVKNTLKEGASW